MDRMQEESKERSGIFLICTGILSALAILTLVIILPLYFSKSTETNTTTAPSVTFTSSTAFRTSQQAKTSTLSADTTTTTSPSIWLPGDDRVDCLPNMTPTQSACENRGCVWSPSDQESANAPQCYFAGPSLYILDDTNSNSSQIRSSLLLRNGNSYSHYGPNFPKLTVETTYISATTLRVKIFPGVQRYEVPFDHPRGVIEPPRSLYNVRHSSENGGAFGVKITRRSSSTTIFDTSFGELMFSDQFAQISTRVASNYVYGFGEHMHTDWKRDMNWKTWEIFAKKQVYQRSANLNGVHPFFLCMEHSGDSYGIFFLNSNAMDVTLQPTPAVTYRTTGGVLDFYVFLGPTPEQVVSQYLNIIGKPDVPPYWSLGFHLSRRGYRSISNVTEVVNRNLATGLPYDVQHFDIDYMDRGLIFTIDEERYSGLGEYVRSLKSERHLRTVLVMNPSVSGNETKQYKPYETGLEYNVFIKSETNEIAYGKSWSLLPEAKRDVLTSNNDMRAHVSFVDFLHPNATAWWSVLNRDFHDMLEFDGLCLDMNEPTSFVNGSTTGCNDSNSKNAPPYKTAIDGNNLYDGTMCMTNKQYQQDDELNTEHYNVHSLYGLAQSRVSQEACRGNTGQRCLIISSSTYPGSGKYSGHSISDTSSTWDHLAASIIGVLDHNIFGIPYVSSDVCGYYGDATYELCARWMQVGAFFPFFRNHNSETSEDQDPAFFGDQFVSDVRGAMEARYSLLPYLYSLFYEAHLHGGTVVRPLMFEFPTDNNTYEMNYQFMWGSGVLITPVIEPKTSTVNAYFPSSRWFDFYSGAEISMSGTEVELPAPINHINLHIQGGNIIPIQESAQTTFESRLKDFGIFVVLDENDEATGKIYWDDGTSVDSISSGIYTEVEFSCEKQFLRSKVKQSHEAGGKMTLGNIHILGIQGPVTSVRVDGEDTEYSFSESLAKLTIENLSLNVKIEFELTWERDNEWSRIDCMPSMIERPNRVACLQRGCTWNPAARTDIPNCFFPLDASGILTSPAYLASAVQLDIGYHKYDLSLKADSRSIYGAALERLTAEIEYQTDNRLHIKIKENDKINYEIPQQILNLSSSISSGADNSSYSVEINKNPFYIKVFRKTTGKVIFDSSIGPMVFEQRFLQISTTLPSENVFGFGEHNHKRYRHDLNWRRWGIFARDWLPVGPFNLYGHQTFFMAIDDPKNGTAVGVYFHNSNAMDVILQPRPSVTYRTTGGVIDFYIFFAESQEAVTQEYHRLIGLPMIPPYWALGFQLSRWGYGSLQRVKEVVNDMREAEIPFDIQYGDIDYMNSSKDFTYDRENFDGLPEFIDQLHEWGLRYVIILDPAIKIENGYEPYDRGVRDGVFVMEKDGVTPAVSRVWPGLTHHADYTNPKTFLWWRDECTAFHNETRIQYDALWVDMNEPSNFLNVSPFDIIGTNCSQDVNKPPYMPRLLWFRTGLHSRTLCMESQQYLGNHYNLHSLYGHTMSRVTHDTLEHIFPNKRSFVITRSTFAGTGHYAGHWLGDNQSSWPPMKWSIIGMLEFNLFGIPYVGADICGFMLDATTELCTRWMQVGAFYPFSRNHNANGRTPQHPTVFGPNSTASSKKVLEIRYSFLPYFYTQHHTAHKLGGTVIRSLVHEFPGDRNTWDAHEQFLVGGAILVTPVLKNGARKVTGYFPEQARWFDYHTGAELGNRGFHVPLEAPLDHINLHIRGGYIIPMQEPAVTTVLSRQRPMFILAALDDDGKAYGTLYWDDGEIRNVEEKFLQLRFICNKATLYIEIVHNPVGFMTDLIFAKVTVLGVKDDKISSVFTYQNSTTVDPEKEDAATYSFNSDKSLTIRNIQLPIDKPHVIKWVTSDL